MYTTAEEVLLYQQHHDDAVQEAMRQVASEDVLSAPNSGMYSSIWTFADRSRLYLEEDMFYKVSENIRYYPDEVVL